MRHVVRIARQQPRVDAPLDAADEHLPHRRPRREFLRPRLEICERPREHHLGQPRIRPAEQPEYRNQPLQILHGIVRDGHLRQLTAQQPEALEEHGPHQAGLVVEQLVDRGHRCARPLGHPPCGEPRDPLLGKRRDRDLQQPVPKLGGALLGSWHQPRVNSVGSPSIPALIAFSADSRAFSLVARCAPG